MDWRQVPADDREPLLALIAEMKGTGYTDAQWGVHGLVIHGGEGGDPLKRFVTAEKVTEVAAFFEAFGKAFIRGEGETVLLAAQAAMVEMKQQDACPHPADAWKYTHNNGYKTCGKCGYFAPCTPEEAMSHYDHGEVKTADGSTYLSFDNRRPLCPACGSHVLIHDRVFDIDRCYRRSCGQLLESVRDDTGFPQSDENHNKLWQPIAAEPPAVGFWHTGQGKWLGEDGHIKTYRLADITGWRANIIDADLREPGMELRRVNLDHTPGDVVPFAFDREADAKGFAQSLTALFEHLTGEKSPGEAPSIPKEE